MGSNFVDEAEQGKMAMETIQSTVILVCFRAILMMTDGKAISRKDVIDGYNTLNDHALGMMLDSLDSQAKDSPVLANAMKPYRDSFANIFEKAKEGYLDSVT